MDSQGGYGGSNTMVLLENEGFSTEAFESLLASGPCSGGFHGPRSAMEFEGVHENRSGRALYGSLGLEETHDLDECLHQPEKKRRLTADQVHFLERSFELENKLEPERKAQLARDLGLEPRQVAIWFQNRRARWKTKQMEKDYEALKSRYDALKADCDNLLMEKQKLHAEVLSLTKKLLLKEKSNCGESGSSESSKIPQGSKNMESSHATDRKKPDAPVTVCKQEDLSSANSAVLDSESPYHTDEGGHSMLMEPDQSDLSHVGEVDDVKVCDFLRLEDNSCNYELPMEDQALWVWP